MSTSLVYHVESNQKAKVTLVKILDTHCLNIGFGETHPELIVTDFDFRLYLNREQLLYLQQAINKTIEEDIDNE